MILLMADGWTPHTSTPTLPMPTIRLATPADAAAVAEIYRPAVVESAISLETVAPDAEEMARRIVNVIVRTPWLVWHDAGGIQGYAYAGPHRERPAYRWAVEVSVYVRAGQHRRGIGRGLYEELFRILTLQRFVVAYAGVLLPNAASVGLHQSLGFTPVGVYRGVGYKNGAWHDVAWYACDLAPRAVPMGEVANIEV